jgi:threonyl-tRNA synthetase
MIRRAYDALGISPARYRLSLPGAGGKYVAGDWDRSVEILRSVLDGLPYDAVEGEAAFYGPKIDVQIADSAGRESTLSTVQVDFHQPERFGLEYVGADAAKHRPVMVHRSVIGSLERAVAHLVEVHGGAFPAWLAPVQLRLLPLSSAELPYAQAVLDRCGDLRAEITSQGSLGARIREGRLVPYQAVIGPEEVSAGRLSLRLRAGRRLDAQPVEDALASIRDAVRLP